MLSWLTSPFSNHRIRKFITAALIAPLFVTVVAPAPKAEAAVTSSSAPQDVAVFNAASGTVKVSWGAPNYGANAVTAYQVDYSTDGSSWTTASSSIAYGTYNYTISGLTSSSSYYIRVSAKYATGNSPYAYPWTKLYGTTNPIRSSNNVVYETGYGLAATGGQAANAYASASFTRVRYKMQYTSNNGGTYNYATADFAKWTDVTGNKYTNATTFNTPAATIATLAFPDATSANIIQTPVSDLTVESSQSSLNDSGLSGRLELWANDYSMAKGAASGTDGSATAYDQHDIVVAASQWGSFQVHDLTNSRTVLAWNHSNSTLPDIGIGNNSAACTSPVPTDWTWCGQLSGVTYYNTTNRDNWKLETFINVPIKVGTNGLVLRYDSKQYASYPGSGTTWGDVSGNGTYATLRTTNSNSSLTPTTSSVSNGTFNINSMQFNGTDQYATIGGNFGYDFSAGISISFYANFGSVKNNWERIIDVGGGQASNNILVSRAGAGDEILIELYSGSGSLGQCKSPNNTTSGIDTNWNHWTFTLDGTTCRIYRNGTQVTSTAYSGLPATLTTRTNAYIGRSNWSADSYFEGGIADLAVYNRAISQGEVISMMDDQKATTVYSDSSGTCATRVANPSNVTVTSIASDCIVKFTAPSNTTTSNTWFAPSNVSAARVLVIGGGGGGGTHVGAGGGAGGMIETRTAFAPLSKIPVTVGAGGTGSTRAGNNGQVIGTVAANSNFGSNFVALGGGAGSNWTTAVVRSAGSGGGGTASGGSQTSAGLTLDPTQGNNGGSDPNNCGSSYGYPTGGGGGAGGPGGDAWCTTYSSGRAGDGGIGKQSDITGTLTYYAGGGGGGSLDYNGGYPSWPGVGGLGGGGNGATWMAGEQVPPSCANATTNAGNGTDGLGGGGGGAGQWSSATCNANGGRGGSGVVIIRYGQTTLTFNSNGGSGYSGVSTLSSSSYTYITLPAQSGLIRSGYTFAGWNSASNGSGTNYSAGSAYFASGNATLYAQWNSVISYNSNGPTIQRVIETTTAFGSEASTTLNSGQALTKGMVTTGLDLLLDASNTRSYPGTGTTWYDISGNGRNATGVNTLPTFDSTNGAFTFNGTNQYFYLGNTSLNYQGLQPYTFGAWVKTTNASKSEQCIICRYDDSGSPGSYLFRLLSGNVESYRTGSNTYNSGYTLTNGVYYYVATTYDGTNINIFVNGQRVYSSGASSMSFTAGVSSYIGNSASNNRLFQGQIGMVQAYNIALTDGQILQNYNALLNKSYETELPTTPGSKAGSTLTGWATSTDTAAAVSGGTYATGLNALPTPYIRLKANDYNGTGVWTPTNYTGQGISYLTATKPTLRTNQTGWGTSGSFSTIYGTSGNSILLGNAVLPAYTFCAMAKFPVNGITLPSTGRMFTSPSVNWLDGWYFSYVGSTHHTAWNYNPGTPDFNWHYYCDTGNDIYLDGVKMVSTYRSYLSLPALKIGGGYYNGSSWVDFSDYEFSEIIIYNQVLSSDQLDYVSRYYKNTYGFNGTTAASPSASLQPGGTFASSGSATLYAVWGSTITYDANGATTGTAPATQVFQRGTGTLSSNSGNLTSRGENFYGWNTAANGSGTFYAGGQTYTGPDVTLYAVYRPTVKIQGTLAAADPITLSPYMRFKASDYDTSLKIWRDSSGNNRDTSYVRGAPSVVTTTANQNGSTKSFTTLQGTTTDGIQFKNPVISTNTWTIFSMARFNGAQTGNARIFDGEAGNFLFGFYQNNSGVAVYNNAWVSGNTNTFATNWVGSTGYADNYRGFGVSSTTSAFATTSSTTNVGDSLQALTINAGQYVGTDVANWQVAEVLIFDRQLSATEIQQVQDYLGNTYGITGYTNQNSYANTKTLATAVGVAATSESVTAINGNLNTYTLSPTISGLTLNTGNGSASISVNPAVAIGTYSETITATDSLGNTATIPVNITVTPPLQWSNSNLASVKSTLGKRTSVRLNLSGGYGTRMYALTHMSSPTPRGITIDTSTSGSDYITLWIDTSTAAGTYSESVTVIDGTNVRRTQLLTITINSPPDINYSASTDAAYPILTDNLYINWDFGNRSSYSGSGTAVTNLVNSSLNTAGGAITAAFDLTPSFSEAAGGSVAFPTGSSQVLKTKTAYTSYSNTQAYSRFFWINLTTAGVILNQCDLVDCSSYASIEFEMTGTSMAAYAYNQTSASVTGLTGLIGNWHYVGYSWDPSAGTSIYLDGIKLTTQAASGTRTPPPTNSFDVFGYIRSGQATTGQTVAAKFLLGAYHSYKSALTLDQIKANYQNTKPRFLGSTSSAPTYSGNATLTLTAGTAREFSVFTLADGTDTKTVTLSGANSAISVETITVTSTKLKVASSITATPPTTTKTYYETMTAVDSVGIATAYYFTINVAPAIAITATVDTVTTTYGVAAYDTFTTTTGTGSGTITFNRVSSSNSSAISNTSVAGAPATAVLKIGATLPVGTYYETFTATDAAGATAAKVLAIIVNPALTLTGPTNSRVETTYSRATSSNISVSYGTGNRTATLLPNVTGITLDSSTINNPTGTIILKIANTLAANTYTETITVTDSVGATSSLIVTIVVNPAPTISYNSATSGALTFVTTSGGNFSTSNFTAALGTAPRTFTISGTNTGISVDTSTADIARVTFGPALNNPSTTTPKSYYETITVTDSYSVTSIRSMTVIVNPAIIETATSTSITTTSGIETTTTIYATQGSSNKTFTLTDTSGGGVTLTSGVNQATLKVLSTANPGSYSITVTASDTSGATTALVISIVVSPPPSMVGASRIETTQGVLFKSPLYAISGGSGTLTMSITNSPTNANITLVGTSTSGGYIQVGTGAVAGTYTSTIRVTDAKGAYSELAVTIVINAPVTLSGSMTITKTYGNSSVNGYSTNGSGTSPFSFAGSPVCAVVRTVSGSYTYEKINGTDSCTWTAPVGVSTVDALLVGAGGGGGADGAGGGGGGSINTLTSVSLPANRQLSVQVGAGGVGGLYGGLYTGTNGSAGGATSITSGATTYSAPGGSGALACGSAGAAGGVTGTGGSASAGGAGGAGSSGTGCTAGSGVAGSAGPSSSFTGSAVNYGGGGAGGPYTATSWSNIGAASGGAGGGGTGAQVKVTTNQGLMQYFRSIGSTPNNATSENAFTTGTCAAVSGNLAYSTDADFPCSAKDYFQGYATGYFIAPITGSITFYISSDDSSELAITVGGTTNKLQISTCCTTVNATWSGFTAGQAYPLSSYFTEIGGGANWQVYYSWTAQNSYTAQGQTIIPASQYAYVTGAEGLTQYFKTFSSPSSATNKEQFTTGTCGQRIGTINFATDTDFPCDSGAQDNFKGYATGYFVAPYTGDITFYSQSDDSSDMVITVNGVDREMSTSIGTATSTFSGFVQGQYYPIKAYFTENTGAASWKLDYSFTGQARTNIPATYLRTLADFTAPTIGTNGLGGGGGSGAAGLYKLSGAQGGSGTVIIKYLTQSDTATETFITAVVNQESPSGLMTLNIPAYVNVGSYTETITVRDAANSAPYLANITITINKATPTARLALPGSVTTATYGTPVAISATTSTPGNVVFKKGGSAITGCSSVATSNGVATCTWTPSIVETASITAILTPTDATNYNSSIETASALSVVVGKADTLTVTAGNLSATYSDDGRDELTVVPSATYSLSGLVSIDSITAVSYLYSGTENNGSTYTSSATSPKRAGTYSITPGTPTFSGTGSVTNYKNVVFTAGTLTINRSARNSWSASYNSGSNQTTYAPNKTESITVSNIGGGGSTMGTIPALSRSQNAATATYSTTSTTCSVDSSTGTISLSGVGSCLIQVVEAQTPNWVSETKTVTMTILRGPRTATISPAATTLKYGETTTASSTIKLTSDGATSVPDSATVTFSAGASTGCQIDAVTGVVTATKGSGTCSISVNYAQTSLYESATSTASVITLARANAPVVTTDSITAMNYTGSQIIVSPTYKVTGILARDISAILPLADVSSTASIAGISASTYTTLTSFSFIGSDNVNGVYWSYNSSVVPSEGGTYAVGGVGLGLRGGLDISNYETPTYITSQLVVLRINQETLTIENSFGDQQVPFKLYTTGGSTGLAVTYPIVRDGTATVCTVTGNMLSSTLRAGTCLVRAKMLGNRNYFDTFSETATINLAGFIPLFDNSAPLNPNTGITISSSTPLDKAADPGQVVAGSCGNACAPTITAVVNAADSTLSVMQQGVIKVTGTDFDNATLVILNRRVNVTSFILVSNSEIRLSLPESIGVGILSVSVQTPGGITPRNSDMTVTP